MEATIVLDVESVDSVVFVPQASDPIPSDKAGLWVNAAGELVFSSSGVAKRVELEA